MESVVEADGIPDDTTEPLLLLAPEELALLFAEGVVGRKAGGCLDAVALRGVGGGSGTFDALVSEPTDTDDVVETFDTTLARDLDLGLAIPDLKDVGALDVGVFERRELEVAAVDTTLPLSESPLPWRLPRSPSNELGALNRWMCVSSSEETSESRGVGGKGMLPPLLLAGEVDLNALKLSDVDDDSVLLEKTGDDPTPDPVPEDPDCEEPDNRATAL